MKKNGTRKVRKNKRTTQRRKNRSYKRMRGGAMEFQTKKKIVKLLTNLIINNFNEDRIKMLCRPQSLPTAEQPLLPTAEQLLLPIAGQPILLKNVNGVNERLMNMYRSIINPIRKDEFEHTFINDAITKSIIEALRAKNITYFDRLVESTSTVPILSPDKFNSSLTSSSSPIKSIFINDALVYSMFALAKKCITLIPIMDVQAQANMNLNDTECPPIAHI